MAFYSLLLAAREPLIETIRGNLTSTLHIIANAINFC